MSSIAGSLCCRGHGRFGGGGLVTAIIYFNTAILTPVRRTNLSIQIVFESWGLLRALIGRGIDESQTFVY